MLRIWICDTLIIDSEEFISFYETCKPNFVGSKSNDMLITKIDNNNEYLKLFGYKFNVKSTIFYQANSTRLMEKLNDDKCLKIKNLTRAFFNLELFNYTKYKNGQDAFLFPFLDFLKFLYWSDQCSLIPEFQNRIKKIEGEIHQKAQLVLQDNFYGYSKQSINSSDLEVAYLDLLNSINDFSNELMFASLCKSIRLSISIKGNHDFVINNNINVEVKTIHDKLTDQEINEIDQSTNFLQKTLPQTYTLDDIKKEISHQLMRQKWIDHLNKAINDQQGKIIFINVTQSPKLYNVILFLEEKGIKKTFDYIINRALEFLNEKKVIPIVVMLESMYKEYLTNYFIIKAPVKYTNSNLILDTNRYTNDYIVKNLIL